MQGLAGSGGFLCIGEGAFVATAGFVLHVLALGYRDRTVVFRGFDPAGGGVDGCVAEDAIASSCCSKLAAVENNTFVGPMTKTLKSYLAAIDDEFTI